MLLNLKTPRKYFHINRHLHWLAETYAKRRGDVIVNIVAKSYDKLIWPLITRVLKIINILKVYRNNTQTKTYEEIKRYVSLIETMCCVFIYFINSSSLYFYA